MASRNSAVQVVGLAELRKELKLLNAGKKWTNELAKLSRKVSRSAVMWSRGEAAGMGGMQAHFAGSIRGTGSAVGARIGIDRKANAAFWGAHKRTGWNEGNATRNQPPWVGASWLVGVSGQGPYAINQAIADHMDDIIEMYGDGIDDITSRAFPD